MKKFVTLALGACMATTFAAAGFAASDMSKMSSSEKMTMQKCQGMSQSAMQGDKDCTALMKKYPDMGTTGSSSGMSGSSSMSGSGSNTSSGAAGMNSQKK